MVLADVFADEIQSELVIDLLKEKVSDVKALVPAFFDQAIGIKGDKDLYRFLFLFLFIEQIETLLHPGIRVFTALISLDIFRVTKLFYDFAGILSISVNRSNNIITFTLERFIILKAHSVTPTIYSTFDVFSIPYSTVVRNTINMI